MQTESNPQESPPKGVPAPGGYRLIRACLRAWIALSRRSVRLLGAERLPDAPAILWVCRPARFREALTLVAALERPVACLMPRHALAGWRSLLVSGAAIIRYDGEAPAWHSALRACTEALGSGCVVAVFESGQPDDAGARSNGEAWRLALEAWAGAFPGRPLVIAPARFFYPAERAQEVLIHVGEALSAEAPSDHPASLSEVARSRVAEVCGRNVFALQPAILERLAGNVEQALRDRLEAEWAARPGRRQKVDGFRLSPLTASTFDRINRTEPEVLVALQQLSDANLEARRQWSLARLRAEQGKKQLSPLQRLAGWTESILGLPISVYGLLNHLIVAPLLLALGLSRKRHEPASAAAWIARAVIVLACYTGQIVLVDRTLGRAAAGYYALTLPVSGIYLWRYGWLLRRRTRILLLGVKGSMLRRTSVNTHRQFLRELEGILEDKTRALARPERGQERADSRS